MGGLEENISINEMQMPQETCEGVHGFKEAAWALKEQKKTHQLLVVRAPTLQWKAVSAKLLPYLMQEEYMSEN